MKWRTIFLFGFLSASAAFAQETDVRQILINGNAPASALGSPFGQSFVPTVFNQLTGVVLATVDNTGVADIHVALWRSDASGSVLLGSPITSGTITAAEINSFYTPAATPLYFPIYFDQSYSQTPGERLAFTIEGGVTLNFYYAVGSSYSNGRILGDASKDLLFATIVPEPGIITLLLIGVLFLFLLRFNKIPATR